MSVRRIRPRTHFGGFQSFIINSNISATAIQTNASVRTFGNYTVTLNGFGANPGYDDRLRGTPVNSGAFSQSLLLRDVIFSPGDGLDVTVDGLNPLEEYRVTVWAFDSGSTGGDALLRLEFKTMLWLRTVTFLQEAILPPLTPSINSASTLWPISQDKL